uniref:NADH-ubiquinone oxidoreductase chain 5 n=1 Tax=Whitmania laevis TaxID=307844 RepID=X2CBT2_WHILA|nr:NADH dehydrogenase subunit 5 [Whitmania laevis]AGL34595.1 NADH dehydrogenase subunit 5 [Whitmania laevis]
MLFHKYFLFLYLVLYMLTKQSISFLLKIYSLYLKYFELIYTVHACMMIPLFLYSIDILPLGKKMTIGSSLIVFCYNYLGAGFPPSNSQMRNYLWIPSSCSRFSTPVEAFLLIGWDGLWISSHIVLIYYLNSKSLGDGMITAITNRIGDVLLLISIVLCVGQCHWYSVDMWFINLYENKTQVMLILGAGMTKSAQIPFSSWLPAAMAAPTPVSALVHSSTLVTAGVFLLIRFYDFLYCFNYFNTVLLLVSIMTMVMSGLAASVEWDMKKIIALSTLSQLGLMMMTLSLNMLDLAYLHMVSHALFKALLFICAGNLIMNFFHSQDLRWMGNLSLQMPLTSLSILLSSMAMGGFPFLSSFYTKDQILELLIYNSWSVSVVVLMYVSIGITVFYSLRFCINLLWMVPMYCVLVSLNENKNVAVPMFIMGLMTVCMSCILLWIYPNPPTLVHMDKLVMLMPLMIIFVGILFALLWSVMSPEMDIPTQLMNNYMWFMVPLSTQVILGFMPNTKLCLELLDQSWLEYLGGYGMHEFLNWMYSYFIKFMNWEMMWIMLKMGLFMICHIFFLCMGI